MSTIGSSDVIGTVFKPAITNASYEELKNMMQEKIPVNATNALIFSIPQKDGEDVVGSGSIWLTDAKGYLYPMTEPINNYKTVDPPTITDTTLAPEIRDNE